MCFRGQQNARGAWRAADQEERRWAQTTKQPFRQNHRNIRLFGENHVGISIPPPLKSPPVSLNESGIIP
jgi:hypothetical protein